MQHLDVNRLLGSLIGLPVLNPDGWKRETFQGVHGGIYNRVTQVAKTTSTYALGHRPNKPTSLLVLAGTVTLFIRSIGMPTSQLCFTLLPGMATEIDHWDEAIVVLATESQFLYSGDPNEMIAPDMQGWDFNQRPIG